MREFINHFENFERQKRIVIARVVKTWGSSPRPVGSALIIDEDYHMYGSVSGGCVEGSVLKAAKEILRTGSAEMEHYGVTDEEAWMVGLSCGGKLDVYIQPLDKGKFRTELFNKIRSNESFYWNTHLKSGNSSIDQEAIDQEAYFSHRISRKPLMLIIGAAHISSDLIHLAKFYDFTTIVIDPRATFAKNINFDEHPDQIIEAYPSEVLSDYPLDKETFAVILSHDPKIDDNALELLLNEPLAYIGALGSKRTQAKRVARLQEAGFTQKLIDRIQAPIGLDINSKTPKEIALSIMAEIIKVKNS
ncbi:XdhC family protein [Portibacter marinus]|uniref:XdhC family protein n=1 Tax=Portibacter marinus TaxID=2898660 RepID=UPI001F2E31F3|nr:XdhC family protein [Portibacter marinus]